MKNILRKVFILCMALTLVMSFTTTSFAAGTVTYDGNAQEFIFEPGSEYSPTDLFSDFKGLMPGESVTQKITVKNDAPADKVVVIYLKSLGAHPDSVDFLSKLNLTVELSGNTTLFDEAPDKPGSLTDWTMLGIFFSGAEVEMDVTVQVPPTLGNEYQNAVGHVDWKFKVEEYTLEEWEENHPSGGGGDGDDPTPGVTPDDPTPGDKPQEPTDKPEAPDTPDAPDTPEPDKESVPADTGDRSELGLYLGIAGVSGLLLLILLVANRKKDKSN